MLRGILVLSTRARAQAMRWSVGAATKIHGSRSQRTQLSSKGVAHCRWIAEYDPRVYYMQR